ncbi:MAG: hypothetical protein AMXMBFR6_26170 [Betaproteobacteria bacterium]|nr:hypothetical protein [Rhodocyclaceae bacterium]MCG3185885.1 hypothetical protein [Rhodocyclaceae bacterium]
MDNPTTMIHVRFAPNGTVTEIGERPPALSPQQWFNLLTQEAGQHYQPLSGGRGLFRVQPEALVALKQRSIH